METYKAMKDRHQEEVNALPLAFAFTEDRYLEKLAAWGITEEEAKNGAIIGIGGGGFIRSSDRDLVIGTFERIRQEERAAIEADPNGTGYIYQMFLYELRNHEFSYTQDTTETLESLGITEEDLKGSEALRSGLTAAIKTINAAEPFDE